MARGSAAWALAIVAVATALVGSLLLTVADPVMQALFASATYSSTTTFGSDLLSWQQDAWTFWPVIILLGIMVMVWVETRRPA